MIRICVIGRDRDYYERLSLALAARGISLRCLEPGDITADAGEALIWDEDDLGDPPGDAGIDGRLTGSPEGDCADAVFKYGSVDSIAGFAARVRKSRKKAFSPGARKTAFFAYSGGSGATFCAENFSLAAASLGISVLFICAESCPRGCEAEGSGEGLSDLLFALSRDSDADIGRFLYEREGVFSIRPPRSERDRILLDTGAYGKILSKAEASGRFQLIVTDVSFSFGGLCVAVLESSDSIFAVTENTRHAAGKLARGLSAAGEDIKKKMRFIVNKCGASDSPVLPGGLEPALTLPAFADCENRSDVKRAFTDIAAEELG